MSAVCGGTRVFSVYVPNGRSLDNEFYAVKLAWLASVTGHARRDVPTGLLSGGVR